MSYLVKKDGVVDAFKANRTPEKKYLMKQGVPIPGVG